MIALGDLLAETGEPQRAIAAYQQAMEADDLELSTAGGLGVGVVLAQHGDLEGARRAFDDLLAHIGSEAIDVVIGQFEIASVLYGPAKTRSMLEHVIASGHADLAPTAQRILDARLGSAKAHEVTDVSASAKPRIYVRSPRTRLAATDRRRRALKPISRVD